MRLVGQRDSAPKKETPKVLCFLHEGWFGEGTPQFEATQCCLLRPHHLELGAGSKDMRVLPITLFHIEVGVAHP